MSLLNMFSHALSEVIIWSVGLSVSMGLIKGATYIEKYGVVPPVAAGGVDLWEGGTVYPDDEFGTAPIVSLGSSAADTQTIEITGLDINGYEVVQQKQLNGTTRVALDTPLFKAYRMENVGTVDLVGLVTVYTGTSTPPTAVADTRVRAIISGSNNNTLMAIYTIPRGYVGFLLRGEAGVDLEANPSQVQNFMKIGYKSQRMGRVFNLRKSISLMTAGSSNYVDVRTFPDPLPAMTTTKITVLDVGVEMGAWSAFSVMLIEQERLPKAFLTSIGQPFSEDWS